MELLYVMLCLMIVGWGCGGSDEKTHKGDAGSQQQNSDQEVLELLHYQLPDALPCQTKIKEAVMSLAVLKAHMLTSIAGSHNMCQMQCVIVVHYPCGYHSSCT